MEKLLEKITDGVPFGYAQAIAAAGGAAHGFSTREGGVSEGIYARLNLGANRGDDRARVRENYRRFCAAVGVERDKLVFASQIHGDTVRTVTSADAGTGLDRAVAYDADGLITDVPGLALTVFGADCLPILLYDPVRRVVAAVHAGWRGTALAIAVRAAEKMSDHYGSDPGNILAAIGPGVGKCCFETHADVPNAMVASLGAAAQPYLESLPGDKFRVDLKGLNTCLLLRAGLKEDHIAISGDCTVCRSDKYWSHRVTGGERGSQAAVIALL